MMELKTKVYKEVRYTNSKVWLLVTKRGKRGHWWPQRPRPTQRTAPMRKGIYAQATAAVFHAAPILRFYLPFRLAPALRFYLVIWLARFSRF